jgi:uncharacterized membrane protein
MTTTQWILAIILCLIPFSTGAVLWADGSYTQRLWKRLLGFFCSLVTAPLIFILIDSNAQMIKEKEQKEGPIKYELVVVGDSLYRKIETR